MEKVINIGVLLKQLERDLAAVTQDGMVLQYVTVQTPELCLVAVTQNGDALVYVTDQTPRTVYSGGHPERGCIGVCNGSDPQNCV